MMSCSRHLATYSRLGNLWNMLYTKKHSPVGDSNREILLEIFGRVRNHFAIKFNTSHSLSPKSSASSATIHFPHSRRTSSSRPHGGYRTCKSKEQAGVMGRTSLHRVLCSLLGGKATVVSKKSEAWVRIIMMEDEQ